MDKLVGLGLWIWELYRCEGGDLDKIIDKCNAHGIRWLAIKAGDSRPNGQVTRARVEHLEKAGIQVAAWWYSVPSTVDTQLTTVSSLVKDQGVTKLIMDAEIEWEQGDHRAQAKDFATRLRASIGNDIYLSDAPWPIIGAHPGWPWYEFGPIMNMRMDQLYWGLAGTSMKSFADRADKNWAGKPWPRSPIGCTVDYTGTKHSPPDDLREFLERYKHCDAPSIWSWQHLNAAEWEVLKEWHESAMPIPQVETAPASEPCEHTNT